MVLKKLGDELTEEFHKVVEYLGHEQSMQVVVEPHEHQKMVGLLSDTSRCFSESVHERQDRSCIMLCHSNSLFSSAPVSCKQERCLDLWQSHSD